MPMDVATAQDATEHLAEVANKIKEMSEAAEKVAEAGKELSSIQKVAQEMEFLGKAGPALGMLGAGLGIVSMIMGTKSAAEQNTVLLNALKDQISTLGTDMKRLFEEATQHADMIAALQVSDALFERSAVLRRRFRYYLDATSDETELGRQHLPDIEDIAQELADSLDKGAASENILLATYASSYGSEGAISLVGSHAIREIYFLLTFSLTVNEIQAGGSNEARKLTDHYAQYVTRIAKATQDQVQECRANWTTQAEDLLTKSIFPNAVLDWSGGYISNAKAFGLALKKNWPQFDWSILVYDQCGGFDRHGFTATGEIWVKPYLRQVCKDGTQPDVDEDKLGANCGNIIVTAVRSEQPRYRPNVDADVRAAFNYLTLWERAVYVGLEECTALKTFRTYGKGFYFYCLREDEVGGVRLGYWSAAASAPELDEAKGIVVYNQGTVQIGRILKSEINEQDSETYYYTLHVWA